MATFCIKCTEPLTETANFCPHCGEPPPRAAAGPEPVVQPPVAQAPVAQAPVAQAPVAQAPVAQAPVAQAPVAQAPVAQGTSYVIPAITADLLIQGVSDDLTRATGDYDDSHERPGQDGAALLQIFQTIVSLPQTPPASPEHDCPESINVTIGSREYLFVLDGGQLMCDDPQVWLGPYEALDLIAVRTGTEELAQRGDQERVARELASRQQGGIRPALKTDVPPSNPRTTSAATISTGPQAPQVRLSVSSGKLFGKVELRIGFDWTSNTLWVDWPGRALRFIMNANLIEHIAVNKSTTYTPGMLLSGDGVMVSTASTDAEWTVVAKVVDQPNVPPYRVVVDLHKKKDAAAVQEKLQALLQSQA